MAGEKKKKKTPKDALTAGQRSLAAAESWLTENELPERIPATVCATLAAKAKTHKHEIKCALKIIRDAGCGGSRGKLISTWIDDVRAGKVSATTVAYNYISGLNAGKRSVAELAPAAEVGAPVTGASRFGEMLLSRARQDSSGGIGAHESIDILRALLSGQLAVLAELQRQENNTWVGAVCGELTVLLQDVVTGAVRLTANRS